MILTVLSMSIVADDNDKKLEELKFDSDPTVLQDNLNSNILEDMRSGENLVKLKVVSGNKEIFKESTVTLLAQSKININRYDIDFGVTNRIQFLRDRIYKYKNKIVKYVDDNWNTISAVHKLVANGDLETIKFLYWFSNLSKELVTIPIMDELPDVREELAKNYFSEQTITDPNKEKFLELSYRLLEAYERGYAFPEWSIYYVMDNFSMLDRTKVYYDSKDQDRIDDIVDLVYQREPVNIGRV